MREPSSREAMSPAAQTFPEHTRCARHHWAVATLEPVYGNGVRAWVCRHALRGRGRLTWHPECQGWGMRLWLLSAFSRELRKGSQQRRHLSRPRKQEREQARCMSGGRASQAEGTAAAFHCWPWGLCPSLGLPACLFMKGGPVLKQAAEESLTAIWGSAGY